MVFCGFGARLVDLGRLYRAASLSHEMTGKRRALLRDLIPEADLREYIFLINNSLEVLVL